MTPVVLLNSLGSGVWVCEGFWFLMTSWCGFLFQVQTSAGPLCSAELTKISSSFDSAMVRLTSTGLSCRFSLITDPGSHPDAVRCDPYGHAGTAIICHITELEPGTLYRLIVISRKDGVRSYGSVHTGKNSSGGLMHLLCSLKFSFNSCVNETFTGFWSIRGCKENEHFL